MSRYLHQIVLDNIVIETFLIHCLRRELLKINLGEKLMRKIVADDRLALENNRFDRRKG